MNADETTAVIRSTQTDSQRQITYDPEGRPGISALLATVAVCTGAEPEDIAAEIGEKGAGALKALTTEAVNEYLSDHRARLELEADPAAIDQLLADGNERANAVADATLEEVRAGMGMAY